MILLNCTFHSSEFHNQGNSFNWGQIFAAFITALVAILVYYLQKEKEQKAKNLENLKEAYLKLLNHFSEFQLTGTAGLKMSRELFQSKNQLLLYGSDRVIKAFIKIRTSNDAYIKSNSPDDAKKLLAAVFQLKTEMRKEIYKNTIITREDVEEHFNEGKP